MREAAGFEGGWPEVSTSAGVGRVTAVAACAEHAFSKPIRPAIELVEGGGVRGDAHLGRTVQHRSRVAVDPSQPNLRQVHLLHAELHDELVAEGFVVGPGAMGENVTTRGIDLLSLPAGAILALGERAAVEVTGLRNPCKQLDKHAAGLMGAVLARGPGGELIRKAGVMAVVRAGGVVKPGDGIRVTLPAKPYRRLEPV